MFTKREVAFVFFWGFSNAQKLVAKIHEKLQYLCLSYYRSHIYMPYLGPSAPSPSTHIPVYCERVPSHSPINSHSDNTLKLTLRERAIHLNLNTSDPHFYTLAKNFESIQDPPPPLSKWQMTKLIIAEMRDNGSLWFNVLLLGAVFLACALSVKIFWDGQVVISAARRKLDEGNWRMGYLYIVDFVIVNTLFLIPSGGLSAGLFGRLNDAYQIVRDNHNYDHRLTKIPCEQLKSVPDSPTQDTITLEPISSEKLKTPRTMVIGKYATDIFPMVRATLAKPQPAPDELPHPFENRPMSAGERQGFLQHMMHFFCLNEEEIMNCWTATAPDDIAQSYIYRLPLQLDFNRRLSLVHTEIDYLWRNKAFLNLLPEKIAMKHCGHWKIPIKPSLPSLSLFEFIPVYT